jgi:hypothetical protein
MPQPGKHHSLLHNLIELLRRLRRRKPTTYVYKSMPDDPHAYKFAPVRRGPKGRSGAAVAEPEDDSYRAFPPRKQ